jgi:hypothetical protein
MADKRSASVVERKWLKVLGTLNEFQARLFVAEKASELGRGGVSRLARLTGMSRSTILKGMQELSGTGAVRAPAEGRLRRAGGGRKRSAEVDPGLERALERIMEESTAGDPMSTLKWTTKSTRSIAAELERRGHSACYVTVARCLHKLGYSLQASVKTIEGPQHPDRDAQFRYLNRQVQAFMRSGDPVISVDTKKKELVGTFRNAGRTWRRQGEPSEVFTHDFPHLGKGKAVPYGTYDVARDHGLVNVGISHDTGEFAVESIRRWWRLVGKRTYTHAKRLLICADAGGSNGPRLRAWKLHLQRLANEMRVPISVCHYPPGTSKWNKIEHRLFSFISLTWKGQPLVSFETVVNLIGSTRTRSGLKVKAVLDTRQYEPGQEISAIEMKTLNLKGDAFHPDWNYALAPAPRG